MMLQVRVVIGDERGERLYGNSFSDEVLKHMKSVFKEGVFMYPGHTLLSFGNQMKPVYLVFHRWVGSKKSSMSYKFVGTQCAC